MSQETLCYSATIYVDGKKAGIAENEGHGGCTNVHLDPAFRNLMGMKFTRTCGCEFMEFGDTCILCKGKGVYTCNIDDHIDDIVNDMQGKKERTTFLSSGGLSKDFTPIQNKDAFKIITQLAGVSDIKLQSGGIWQNGAGVYAQVSLGSDMIIGKDYGDIGHDKQQTDTVRKYLSIVNSHDGSRALTVLITPYRFFCANQIARAYNTAKKSENQFISIRHNASAEEKIDELLRTVHIADEAFQITGEAYNKMAQMKINEEYVKEVLTRLFPLNHIEGRGKTIWENKMTAIKNRINFADAGRIERNTAWNLYNAIQGTMQQDARNSSSKNRSILMGAIADQSAEALTTVMEVCSSEHIPASVHAEIDAMINGMF